MTRPDDSRSDNGSGARSGSAPADRDAASGIWLDAAQGPQGGFHKGLLDAVGEAVIVTDLAGKVVYWNRAAEELYGWSAREALGMDIVDLTPSDASRRDALAIMESLAAGETWRGEFQVRRKDGTTFTTLVSNSPIFDSEGELAGIIGVSSDLTSVKKAERELVERNKELRALKRVGEILNREEVEIEARLDEAVAVLPEGWRHPEITEARLLYDSVTVQTPGFHETDSMQSATFSTSDGEGRLEIALTKPPAAGDAFEVPEEQELLDSVARMVGQTIERASMRRLLTEAFSALQEAVFLVDAQRGIRFVNSAAEEIFGYRRDELLGRSTEILHENEKSFRRFVEASTPALLESGTFVDDFRLRRHDGSLFDAEQTLALLNPHRGLEGGIVSVIRDVSERREAQRELRESETRFRRIAEHIEDVFWVIDPGEERVEYVSPAYEEVWGRSVEALYADGEEWLRAVVTEDRDRVRSGVERQSRGPHTQEYRIRRPDGSERWIVDRSFPVYDDKGKLERIIGVARDVTEERLVEERFGRLSEEITDVIYVLSPQGTVIESSPSVEAAIGYTRQEFEGMDAIDLVHPDDRDAIREALRRVAGEPGKVARAEYRVVAKSGDVLHVETVARNLVEDPAVQGILITSRDVTERLELERRVQQMQKMESIGRLAGGVAHDFNNILTVIRSQADLILMDTPDETVASDVEVIQSAADRAAKLTKQLLAFSREQVLQPQVLHLGEVVREASDLIDRLLGERVRIRYRTGQDLPTVCVDPNRIEQVLVNLAVNARDAMPGGGDLDIAVYAQAIEEADAQALPGIQEGQHVVLEVTDTGTGMPEDIKHRIFEPFFTTKAKGEGTGLGLSMVYGTVRQSGGTIRVDSVEGEGTSFYLYFPTSPAAVGDASSPLEAGDARGPLSGRVLLVEDDAQVRKAASRVLGNAGFSVVEAESGAEALKVLGGSQAPDLMLTDLGLGDMSGFQLLDRVAERWPDLPVVVMSGYAEGSPGRREGLPAGIPFVQKPFTPAGLMNALRAVLAESRGPRRMA